MKGISGFIMMGRKADTKNPVVLLQEFSGEPIAGRDL
jgi:hypothetical protein